MLCCGAPLLAQVVGFGVVAGGLAAFHGWLHGREWLLLLFSATVFSGGLALELRLGRFPARPSPLLVVSAACLSTNLLIYTVHSLHVF